MGTHGKTAKLLGFGYDLTGYFRQVTSRGEVAVADKTVLGNDEHAYDVGMQSPATINASGLYSDATGDIQRKLETILGTNGPVAHLPDGYASAGVDALCVEGTATRHSINIPHDEMVDVSLEAQGQQGLEIGRLLNPFATDITATANGSAVDFGDAFAAPSGATGVVSGSAYLFVTGTVSGTNPTLDVTIEDSADGSTGWATVGTFTQVTATAAAQRIDLTAGQLERYLRAVFTVGGTDTPTFAGVAVIACKYAD